MTLVLGITHVVIALITIGLSIPLILGKVPMNDTYGIRIPAAFQSDENWYKANRYGGKAMLGWSLPVLAIGVGLIVLHFRSPIPQTNLLLVLLFSFSPVLVAASLPQIMVWSKKNLTHPDKTQTTLEKTAEE